MKGLLLMPTDLPDRMFDAAQLARLHALLGVDPGRTVMDLADADAASLADVEVVVTGWGSPRIDAAALDLLPRLQAIVHTAGTIRFVVDDAVWERGGIVVTSSTEANAVPVAEFALAQILLAGKRSLRLEAEYRRTRAIGRARPTDPALGNYGAVVGLIGASRIGRLVAEHLRGFDVDVLIADPFVDADGAAALGASKVELTELFSRSDVVSLHAPDVPSTRGMVTAALLAAMRDGTTFINTARPALVDLDALRAELVAGRISAVLDVDDHLAPDDPLWDAPAVSITPHLAGSHGNETRRMGEFALEEIRRLVAGEPPRFPVDPTRLDITA